MLGLYKLSILDRYVGRMYMSTTLFVTLVFIAVIGVIQMIGELSSIGGAYHFSHALSYVGSIVINYIYQLFPIISMIGAILALGHLASGNELIVLRTSGASIKKIMLSLSKMALILLCFVTLVGEGFAPELAFIAQKMKAEKLNNGQALSTLRGTWVRHGSGFTHFGKVLGNAQLSDVTHYQFNQQHRLSKALHAERARLVDKKWQLFAVAVSDLSDAGVQTSYYDQMMFDIGVSIRAMQLSKLNPDQQTLRELNKVISYRSARGMSTGTYQLNFWQRLVQPLETLLLACLVVPFMMGPLRSATMGLRLLTGIIFGFAFYFTSQFFGPFAIMYPFPPWLAALLPSLLLMIVGQQLLRYMGD